MTRRYLVATWFALGGVLAACSGSVDVSGVPSEIRLVPAGCQEPFDGGDAG